MTARLLHYSAVPIGGIHHKAQGEKRFYNFKPEGLWVSVEGGDPCWDEWCRSEGFRDHDQYYVYEAHLTDGAKILRLNSASDIIAFSDQFLKPNRYDEGLLHDDGVIMANWAPVAEQYEGIIIAPYQWSLRLDNRVSWYYSWDCASGCIWSAHAVELSLVREPLKKGKHDAEIRDQA